MNRNQIGGGADRGERADDGPVEKALDEMRERVRRLTRRTCGRSLARVVGERRSYLVGWKNHFRLAARVAAHTCCW